MDQMLGAAAKRVVVQVERVVSNEQIRRDPERTMYWRDTTVVLAPFGTHPYSSGGMIADEEHLREFLGAVRDGEAGVTGYLDRYVHDPADHEGYLEEVGVRRLDLAADLSSMTPPASTQRAVRDPAGPGHATRRPNRAGRREHADGARCGGAGQPHDPS